MPGYRNKDGRGRKPATKSVRYISANLGKRFLRFSFSEDVVARLCRLDGDQLRNGNLNRLRLRPVRYPWLAPHATLFQITEMVDPGTYVLRKGKNHPRWVAEILAIHFEVKPGVPGHTFTDISWDHRGMLVQFPLEAMTDEALERWERIERWRKLKEAAAG